MACTVTNTVEQWRDAARLMKLPLDSEGGFNAFIAARETSKKPGCTAIVLMRDGQRRIYRDGQKVEK